MRSALLIISAALTLVWAIPAIGQIPYPFMSIPEIQEVQAGEDSSHQSAFPMDTIWTTGIVTVGAGEMYAGGNITLYMQDAAGGPWSGILLFNSDNSAFNVSRGDSIIVIGTIGEYTTRSDSLETGYNIQTSMTELVTTEAVLKVGEDKPRPEIILLTPSDIDSLAAIERSAEQYEGCQVRVENVVVTSQESAYRQFWVSDDGGWSESCVIRLYADSLYNYPIPPAGSVFESITGVVYHVYGNYTLLCRKPEDLVLATGAPLIGYAYGPTPPQPEDTVRVDITIVDDGSILEATLFYQLNGGEFTDLPLEHLGGASYLGRILPQPVGTSVGFYITATDNVGNTSYEPENAPDEVISYVVVQSIPTTIYDINYTTDAGPDGTYPSPLSGTLVTATGIVTANHSVSSTHFYLQDETDPQGSGGAWHGIYVYDAGKYKPAVGDKIIITANVAEYYGKTELLNIAAYTLISSGNPLPGPAVIQTGDIQFDSKASEPWEGVFVRINDVTVTNPDADTYHNWHISDGSGTAQMDAPATAPQYTFVPQLNDHIEFIQGCVEYTYDQFEIEVRSDDDIGPVTHTGVDQVSAEMPASFALSQNYPNPFNPVTQIAYRVPRETQVKVEIFNILGQKVCTLVDATVKAGNHVIAWRGRNEAGAELASGIYLCRFQADDIVQTRKMVLVK